MNTSAHLKMSLVVGALTSTHFTIRITMPLLLGVLAAADGFSDEQLGDLGSAYSAGATLVALTSVVWMRGLLLRVPVLLFLVIGIGALASVVFVYGYPSTLASFLLAGIGLGGVYSLMIALLARTDDPNRSFGWQWGLGSLPGVLLLYALPTVAIPTGGAVGTFTLIVATNVVMALAATALPNRLKPQLPPTVHVEAAFPNRRFSMWIGLFGLFAVYVAITGSWSFLGRVATRAGLGGQFSGTTLAIRTAVSSLVGLAAGQIGDVGARRSAMTTAVTVMLVGLALIAWWPTRFGYAIGTTLFIGLATFVLTFSIGIISRPDPDRRVSGLPAAALGAGSILGPAMAGHVYQADGARTMLLACGTGCLCDHLSQGTLATNQNCMTPAADRLSYSKALCRQAQPVCLFPEH